MHNKEEYLSKDLTKREYEILRLLAQGLSNKDISKSLNLTLGTIRVYLSIIYSKMEVSSRTQAVLALQEQELLVKYN